MKKLETGKEYFLYSEQFKVTNRVIFSGMRKYTNAKKQVTTIYEFFFSRRTKGSPIFSVHEFEFELGHQILSEKHLFGKLVS